ncbi:SAM-dependent methyltransferase [Streptomyces albidoflavus]
MPDAPRPDTAPTRALIRSKGEPEAPYDGGPPAHDNIRKPWPGRVYDVLTAGGCRHSYQSDRAWGQALVKALPWAMNFMQINRRHKVTGTLVLAELGIEQFIDLGCGYPTNRKQEWPDTVPLVRTVHSDARVMYVDVDPYVCAFANTDLATGPGMDFLRADARDIPAMLAADRLVKLFDLTEPIGVILHDVLPWLGDDEAARAMRDLHELLPAGSAVSLTHATADENPAGMEQLVQAYTEAGFDYRPRTLDQITELVGPWDLLAPGLQPTSQWRRDQPPHIPAQFLPDLRLPQDGSHAYAAVTAPKTAAPPAFT